MCDRIRTSSILQLSCAMPFIAKSSVSGLARTAPPCSETQIFAVPLRFLFLIAEVTSRKLRKEATLNVFSKWTFLCISHDCTDLIGNALLHFV